VKLQKLLHRNNILLDINSDTKTDVITQMGKYLASLYNIPDPEMIIQKIIEREGEMSTGIGYAIALPHARVSGVEDVHVIVARTSENIEFDAIDEQPVRLLFMVVSPLNTPEHTKILSTISHIIGHSEIRKRLINAENVDTFLQILIDGENEQGL
jgi:mannitol/fructose-specific phosphotransferase system IIA component (Ntr-type)